MADAERRAGRVCAAGSEVTTNRLRTRSAPVATPTSTLASGPQGVEHMTARHGSQRGFKPQTRGCPLSVTVLCDGMRDWPAFGFGRPTEECLHL